MSVSTTPSITCPACGRISYHPIDIAEGYCGSCHDWTTPVPRWCVAAEGRVAHRMSGRSSNGVGVAMCGAVPRSPWLPVDESLVPQCQRCLEISHDPPRGRS